VILRDTTWQKRFRSLIPSYIHDSSVVVIVFDVATSGCRDGDNQLLHQDWNCVHNFGSTHGKDTRNYRCRTVYHGVILGPESRNCRVDSDIWSSALRFASLSKHAASTGAFSSSTLLRKIFSSSLGCFFTYLKTVPEATLKIVGVL